MKLIISGALAMLSYVSIYVCGIWAIVSFVLYLVKDKSFDWNSVWCTIASLFATIVMFMLSAYFNSEDDIKLLKTKKTITRSRWQERMAELQKQHN